MTHTLVVGGTRGIGRAAAARFTAQGHAVTVVARRRSDDRPDGVREVEVDLRETEALPARVAEIAESGGPFTNLVLLQRFRGDGDEWAGELAVSLTATKTIVEAAAPAFAPDGGSVVVVGSQTSRLVARDQPAGYHAAKAALRQLVRWYAVELGPRGIRVNCVTPGAVLKEHGRGADAAAALDGLTPLGRIAGADDVAAAIALLCSDDARFVTGQELVVDGGLSLLLQEQLAQSLRSTEAS